MSKQFIIYLLLTVTVMLAANTYASEYTKSRHCWSQYRQNLQYANKDARQLKTAMQNRFKAPNKQVCFIENVSRAEFEQALIDLKPLVRSQDLVIIIFSGHGSWVKDDNGDESDGYDIEMPDRDEVITDDRLVVLALRVYFTTPKLKCENLNDNIQKL